MGALRGREGRNVNEERKWLTPQEVARELRVAVRTVHNLIARGELLAIRVGRLYRIAAEDLEVFIERQKQEGQKE